MKLFIIHSNKDNDKLEGYIKQITDECKNVELLILKDSTSRFWKADAAKQIKQADCALFFVGDESHKSEWIDWELKKFIKTGRPVFTYKLAPENVYNEVLYLKTTFGSEEYIDKSRFMYSKELPMDVMCQLFSQNLEINITDDIVTGNDLSESAILEQYKIYLKTSEDLVSRRQSVSNFYISVNSILISVLSALIAVINALKIQYATVITFGICIIISVVGIILCLNWRKIIASYGMLNSAKMKVISAIEQRLPFNLYDVEWKVQTNRLKQKKAKYVSFTNIEKRIPTLFLVLYCLVLVVAVVLLIVIKP